MIAHLADLNFGTEDSEISESLHGTLLDLKPRLIVVSGNLTKQGRPEEFMRAREFLLRLPAPVLAIPGFKDIVRGNILARVFRPFERFQQHVSRELSPFTRLNDQRMAIHGLNTLCASASWRRGRLSMDLAEEIRNRLLPVPSGWTKCLVASEPLRYERPDFRPHFLAQSHNALDALEDVGVDVVFSGADHRNDHRVFAWGRIGSVLLIQAGSTPIEKIPRSPCTFNWVRLPSKSEVFVEVMAWTGRRFAAMQILDFQRQLGAWQIAASAGSTPSRMLEL